ncbi:MAG TPA: GDSL-type esterase/lipase family protein [Terriglobales bacterium]|nr:GDSL-type esterase/lipase family protein [Terriglobales bacterium]
MKLRIVGLGDSTTAGAPGFLSPLEAPPDGAGNPESQYAYWIMRKRPDWTVLNRGINGQRIDEILARFEWDVIHENADWIIILGGVNDVYQGVSLTLIKENLATLHQRSLSSGIRSVACTILPYNTASEVECNSIRELNRFIENKANQLRIAFCDTNRAVSDPNNPDQLRASPDGYHPDVSGYRNMADALTQVVQDHSS